MTAAELLAALDLPEAALIDRRVPKTLLVEHGARTPADKRKVNEGVERAVWVAALKPATVGVTAYDDEVREYLEIAVLHLELRPGADLDQLVLVMHRAVPYPVVGIMELAERITLSLAHLRRSQREAGKTVLDGSPVMVEFRGEDENRYKKEFLEALALGRQPRSSLHALYTGWIDVLAALQAARRTGMLALKDSAAAREKRREALGVIERLESEAKRLRAAASNERQMAKRVELNLELKRAEAALADAAEML